MPLSATYLLVDNSGYSINGDYLPTRLSSCGESVSLLANVLLQDHQESEVGLLTLAKAASVGPKGGNRVNVVVTLTRDLSILLNRLNDVKSEGECDFLGGLKVAQLALKNRGNKSQKQKIVLFVGSPMTGVTKDELVKLGKLLKKNSVGVDVINYGDDASITANCELLEDFVNAVNNADNSKLLNVPPGPHNLSDMVISIMQGVGAASVDGATSASAASFMGVDPNLDPELAMVLRASMEEEDERQKRSALQQAAESAPAAAISAEVEDDEAILAAAIAMSMNDVEMTDATTKEVNKEKGSIVSAPPVENAADDVNAALRDPDFLNSLLDSLPGVDKNEIDVNELLNSLEKAENKKPKEESKK